MIQKGTHTSLLTLNTHTDNRCFRSTSSMSSRLGWWIWRRGGRTALSSCRCNAGFPLCSSSDSAQFGVLSTCTWCSGFVAARSWCPPYFHWGWGCWCCPSGTASPPVYGPAKRGCRRRWWYRSSHPRAPAFPGHTDATMRHKCVRFTVMTTARWR